MKKRTIRRRMRLWAIFAATGLSFACASFKVTLVDSYQSTELLLAAVDDSERILCFGSTDVSTLSDTSHCTVATPGLTDERHQALSRALARAFDAQDRLAPVLKAYQPGQPMPVDLATLQAAASEVAQIIATVDPSSPIATWLKQANAWLAQVKILIALVQRHA